MSEFLDVSFYVLCRNDDDTNFCMGIVKSIGKIPGIISVWHIDGTNVVEASANWTEPEYYERIQEIQKVVNGRQIKIVKKIRHVVREIIENVKISEKVSWKIKTAKARKISSIVEKSYLSYIIEESRQLNIKVKFLIFGPGHESNEYKTHRVALKNLIENIIHQRADFPENLDLKSNPLLKEYSLMRKYDYTIILMMSVGSISEYSTFFTKPKVAHKIRLFILKKHARSKSYLANGPIRTFRNHYRQVYTFSQPEDMLEKATKMLINILEYRIISD